jgi:phosphonate transport system substrate-binding protein
MPYFGATLDLQQAMSAEEHAMKHRRWQVAALAACLYFAAQSVWACTYRGDLDTAYCDENRDLVADVPPPPAQVAPKTLVVALTALEDEANTADLYKPLIGHLRTCMAMQVEVSELREERPIIAAMRAGRVQVANFATGGMMFAVNFAGAVPFAGKGMESVGHIDDYQLYLLVRADSPYQKLLDLRGKTIAHVSAISNSGNLAPRALFAEEGLVPERDYKVVYSGRHDKSISGLNLGLWDAAPVASGVFERMIARGEIRREQFRVIYKSGSFPRRAFAHTHVLDGKIAEKMRACFLNFRFPPAMAQALEGNNRFYAVDYRQDWRLVRFVAKAAGQKFDAAEFERVINAPKPLRAP